MIEKLQKQSHFISVESHIAQPPHGKRAMENSPIGQELHAFRHNNEQPLSLPTFLMITQITFNACISACCKLLNFCKEQFNYYIK